MADVIPLMTPHATRADYPDGAADYHEGVKISPRKRGVARPHEPEGRRKGTKEERREGVANFSSSHCDTRL